VPARPLLLLPPSKGKTAGGDGPPFGATLGDGHPLTGPRREVLTALVSDVPGLDDRTLARVAGVAGRDVDRQRHDLPRLERAPTLPAHRRYTGIVHGNAGLDTVDPTVVVVDVRIVSPLLGLVALADPVPAYRLELSASLPSLGGLGPFWRRALADELTRLGAQAPVWDLLPGEHRRAVDPAVRDELDVREIRFVRPDGRAANAARTKVAKGRLAAMLLAEPDADPATLAREADAGEGWQLSADGPTVTATYSG
jgi:cytoplasmic iron level regulating protein YaaA (DUF328/UPF0246 family)